MQEGRHLAAARPRDGNQDEEGEAVVTSRAVEFREFNDEARCIPCQRLGRACHVKEGAESCIQCSITSTAHDCYFLRKVLRQDRLNGFAWAELTGYSNSPYRNHRESHGPHVGIPPQHYQEPPRPAPYPPFPHSNHAAEPNHVERTWASYQQQQQPPVSAQPLPHVYNGTMPPPKRQRSEMYDGKDVFAHSRPPPPHSAPPGWQSPHRAEFHLLPEIRPLDVTPHPPRPDQTPLPREDRPASATKILDLKPPAPPPGSLKRKLEPEEIILPHRCSKCEASFKTPAELKKHFARHEPQYFCNIPGCSRSRDGFTTKNDLDRHRKTMHKILSPNDRFWKCFYPDCAKTEKVWPRLDNFKAHITRMHGSQYVAENVSRAEEWWDTQKTPLLGRSPETTHDLVAIEPKPAHEPSRLGVTNLLTEPPNEHLNGRRRHLSAEGRQEAAQVREMGACLRCALLKEKCDDNRVCHRCSGYANKHFNGGLICRRGNIADFLIPLIPLFSNLPQPEETTKGWNLRTYMPQTQISTFLDLLGKDDYPSDLQKYDVRQNTFTTALFHAIDETIAAQESDKDHTRYGTGFEAEVDILRQIRQVCCLLYDCVLDALNKPKPTDQEKADLLLKLQKTNLELREWYDELDNAVFDWKTRHLELNHHPMKKWNIFFSICAMLLMERLTVLLTRAWAYVTEVEEDSTDDEAADTLCALLELKFQRQDPSQHHFISMLLEDKSELMASRSQHPILQLAATACGSGLRSSMGFLKETKGFETWKWLYEQFGDSGVESEQDVSPRTKLDPDVDSEDSDTVQGPDVEMRNGERRDSVRSGSVMDGSDEDGKETRSGNGAKSEDDETVRLKRDGD